MRAGFKQIRNRRVILVIAACVPFLAGCASSIKQMDTEVILPEIDVIQVKENSDEALRVAQEAKIDVGVLSSKVSDLDNRLILLSEEVASISSAKIEELETKLALLTEAYKDLHDQLREIESSTLRLAAAKQNTKPVVKTTPAVPTFSPSSASDLLTTSPEYDLYQNGLRTFNSRNYEQAAKVFSELLAKFPEGSYCDNAQFWIGESRYRSGNFNEAISAFQKVFSYANSAKSDDAQLKIGLAYQKLGKTDQAKAEFQKLIDRYPASEYVERARNYISGLK